MRIAHAFLFCAFCLPLSGYCAENAVPACAKPAPLLGNLNPKKPLIGIRIKDHLPDPKASVVRIVKKYNLKKYTWRPRPGGDERVETDLASEILGNNFFSNYFTYDNPSAELVAALRCDLDVASVDYYGKL
jgi:hypothetical protein